MKSFLGTNKPFVWLGSAYIFLKNNIVPYLFGDGVPPMLTSNNVDQITTNSFRVTWTLDEGATGYLEYGTTQSYGNTTPIEEDFLTTHIQTISGLNPSTEYHYRIKGEDENGNQLISDDFTVNTQALGVPVATVAATDSSASEAGTSTGEFTVSLDQTNNTGSSITVNYSVGGTATPSTDYNPLSGSVDILDGTSSTVITITPVDDADPEPTETVQITLTSGTGYTVGSPNSATVNILDNDSSVGSCTPDPSPTSVTNLAGLTGATPGDTVQIDGSINATGATFASNLIIVAGTGQISGTNIDINGACIHNEYDQIFTSSARFSSLYTETRLSPEVFGAVGNGSTNDNAAIDATIINCRYGIGNPTSNYVKNNPSTYTRSGEIDFDWNGSTVSVTSTSGFNMNQVTTDYVMTFTNTNVIFSNGTFSGGNVYGRAFRFNGQNKIHFIGNEVLDWYAPVTIRCVVFYMDFDSFDSTGGGVQDILFDGNTVHDIVAEGDGNYNNSPAGIAKGWWYSISNMSSTSTFSIIHQNNTVYNIIGDDAEAFYAIGGTTAVNPNGTWLLDNETMYNCTRRCIKVNASNFTVQNCTLEEIDNNLFIAAQQMGSMVDFFRQGSSVQNITVHNNIIRARPGQDTHYYLLSFTEANNITVTNNTITQNELTNYGSLRFGSATGTYAGYLENITVSGNTFNNGVVQMLTQYAPVGQLEIDNNDFNFTDVSYPFNGVIRTTNTSGTRGNIDFTNNNVVVNISGNSGNLNGFLYTAGSELTNILIDNCTITYSNGLATRPFGYVIGNFGNSNTIQDCTIIGDVGTEALVVTGGVQNPVIINSFGDGSTPITVQ